MKKTWFSAVLICTLGLCLRLAFFVGPAQAGAGPFPGPRDKCPVCGMFIAKYPEWTASIQFGDGSHVFFDGVKDMLKFYLTPQKYGSRTDRSSMGTIRVKDYYSLEMIDGRNAYYVIGSDVFGPMGKELIPFARQTDAAEFLRDHRGRRILRFNNLDNVILQQLELH